MSRITKKISNQPIFQDQPTVSIKDLFTGCETCFWKKLYIGVFTTIFLPVFMLVWLISIYFFFMNIPGM
ncbi:MAG: hypothetical protein GPJ54_17150 [Candidatus Heimdallarchaeota archaeon]|nr:hypothetical protein [Candidatus Heimdallarchaeota archaeon]